MHVVPPLPVKPRTSPKPVSPCRPSSRPASGLHVRGNEQDFPPGTEDDEDIFSPRTRNRYKGFELVSDPTSLRKGSNGPESNGHSSGGHRSGQKCSGGSSGQNCPGGSIRDPQQKHPSTGSIPSEHLPIKQERKPKVLPQELLDLIIKCSVNHCQEMDRSFSNNIIDLKVAAHMICAIVGIGMVLIYLRDILVTFFLAIFFTFLTEPVLFLIMNPFKLCAVCSQRASRLARYLDSERVQEFGVAMHTSATKKTSYVYRVLWRIWGVAGVIACLCALGGLVATIITLVVKSIEDCPWQKYAKSPNLQKIISWFPQLGVQDPSELDFNRILQWMARGPLVDAIGVTFTIMTWAFLCLLFIAFLLFNNLSHGYQSGSPPRGGGYFGLRSRLRRAVQKYIVIKTILSFVLAIIVACLLYVLDVDLAILFAVLTLILNFIPHIGSTIASLAPLPIVWLDPTKDWFDLVLVAILLFLVHHGIGNVLEPKIMSVTLALHPIIVILSLVFWSTMWGAMGAVLSVPVTSVFRILLREIEHPWVWPLVCFLEGRPVRDMGTPPTKEEREAELEKEFVARFRFPWFLNAERRRYQEDDTEGAKLDQLNDTTKKEKVT